MSKVRRSPSSRPARPARWTAVLWTKASACPSSRATNPKPLVMLKNLTVPDVRSPEIGRASCRERVCLYVEVSVVDVSLHNHNDSATAPTAYTNSDSTTLDDRSTTKRDRHALSPYTT